MKITYANDYYYGLFGMEEEEYSSLKPDEAGLQLAYNSDFLENADKTQIKAGEEISFYFKARKKNHELTYIGVIAKLIRADGETMIFDACAQCIDWIVNRLSNYDKLTGLPKIHTLNESFAEMMNGAGEGERFAVISADFNNFKLINEKIGGEKGDEVLIAFGKAINTLAKNRGCCCRVFSDKYVMFFQYSEDEDVKGDIENLIDGFTKKLRGEFDYCNFSVSAGLYLITAPDDSNLTLFIDKANIARKNAKLAQNAQENSCMIYKEEMKNELNRAMQITAEAERAIQKREFVVYYQPKISLKTKTVIGAEALVRWKKPDGTLVPPGEFLPYLEKSSFIKEVDFYVYDDVCRCIRAELDKGKEILPVSVNVSRVHLKDDDFIEKVNALAEKYDIPPELLEFELTENAFLDDEQSAVQILKELREKGFMVSIDDFGSGYSSLNLLKSLPVDILKLDRAFFGRSDLIENNAIVVNSIIDMASRMKINVICEGVETAEQVEFLKNTECDSVQGFYYAKPIPQEEFEGFKNKFDGKGS
ncbi:MAG: bifunctional diguanylate cyclase/phosphodiesterase [Oscillospiraceae bacterium]|nr:bifunctional diguanylate cyclase/phosphodiesterase [Oscillospiraceae bacterium]